MVRNTFANALLLVAGSTIAATCGYICYDMFFADVSSDKRNKSKRGKKAARDISEELVPMVVDSAIAVVMSCEEEKNLEAYCKSFVNNVMEEAIHEVTYKSAPVNIIPVCEGIVNTAVDAVIDHFAAIEAVKLIEAKVAADEFVEEQVSEVIMNAMDDDMAVSKAVNDMVDAALKEAIIEQQQYVMVSDGVVEDVLDEIIEDTLELVNEQMMQSFETEKMACEDVTQPTGTVEDNNTMPTFKEDPESEPAPEKNASLQESVLLNKTGKSGTSKKRNHKKKKSKESKKSY
jgi:hypothetical protein